MVRSSQHGARVGALALLLAIAAWAPAQGAGTGSFQPAGKMAEARWGPRAILLADGSILVTGGIGVKSGEDVPLASAERFDPKTNRSTALPPMAAPRDDSHQAVQLKDGWVLITGGSPDFKTHLRSAELFDPARGTFAAVGDMIQSRAGHTATLLSDGRVLIAGGFSSSPFGPLATAEIFDPATGTFGKTSNLAVGRYRHAAVALPDGRVVILGGYDPSGHALSSAEIYDPQAGTFSRQGDLEEARGDHTATLLPDGRILVTGGIYTASGGGPGIGTRNSVEIYDPATGRSTIVDGLSYPRVGHTVTTLRDGRLLVTGGLLNLKPLSEQNILRTAEFIDPATGRVSPAPPMTIARFGSAAVLLPDGRVLILGGDTWDGQDTTVETAEVYVP